MLTIFCCLQLYVLFLLFFDHVWIVPFAHKHESQQKYNVQIKLVVVATSTKLNNYRIYTEQQKSDGINNNNNIGDHSKHTRKLNKIRANQCSSQKRLATTTTTKQTHKKVETIVCARSMYVMLCVCGIICFNWSRTDKSISVSREQTNTHTKYDRLCERMT